MSQLTDKELIRYNRHIIIPEFGIEGQQNLKKSSVLVVGTGGLGAPVLQYLTAAGVGRIGIIDFDVVEESNLQRQVLFTIDDVGSPKVEVAKKRLEKLNPYITIETYNKKLTSENALDIISKYDITADGTDNFPTRYLVNDACVKLGKTNVYASIFRFEGQLSVFNYRDESGEYGPNFRDIYPTPPPPDLIPNCAEGGVLGVLPGIIGSMQANEVIKIASGVGEPLSGKLFIMDTSSFISRTFKIKLAPSNKHRTTNANEIELIDYEIFCGLQNNNMTKKIKEITVEQLQEMIMKAEDFQLIDVRESHEYGIANIDGLLIPQGNIPNNISKIDKDKKVVVHCRSGKRSADVIEYLQENHDFVNLYNLKGGILEWSDKIDSSVQKY